MCSTQPGYPGDEGVTTSFTMRRGYIAFRGYWKRKSFRWEEGLSETGPWTPEMEKPTDYSADLVAEDGTVRLDPNWEPPTEQER